MYTREGLLATNIERKKHNRDDECAFVENRVHVSGAYMNNLMREYKR